MADENLQNPLGWVKDSVLTDEIIKCLDSTDSPDYVYTLSLIHILIPLKKGDKEYKVRVAVITENYMSHYLYMTPRVYEQTFGAVSYTHLGYSIFILQTSIFFWRISAVFLRGKATGIIVNTGL